MITEIVIFTTLSFLVLIASFALIYRIMFDAQDFRNEIIFKSKYDVEMEIANVRSNID